MKAWSMAPGGVMLLCAGIEVHSTPLVRGDKGGSMKLHPKVNTVRPGSVATAGLVVGIEIISKTYEGRNLSYRYA